MAKITFTSLKLKTNTDIKTVEFGENKIEVLQYLPIDEKYDLIMIALQKAEENGIYNQLKLDTYFHLNIVYLYTNITFTDKQRENESKLYDMIESNGLIESIIGAIPEEEYSNLCDMLEAMVEKREQYNISTAGALKNIIDDLPANAQAAMDVLSQFNVDDLKEVAEFVRATNGGKLPSLIKG